MGLDIEPREIGKARPTIAASGAAGVSEGRGGATGETVGRIHAFEGI
jgi:hypothetical protein